MKNTEKLFKRLLIVIPIIMVIALLVYGIAIYVMGVLEYKALEVDDSYEVHDYSGVEPEAGAIEEDQYGNYKYSLKDNQVLVINRDKQGMHGVSIYDLGKEQQVDTVNLEISDLYTTTNGDINGFLTTDGTSYKMSDNYISPFSGEVESIIPSLTGYTYLRNDVLYSNGQAIAYSSFDCRFKSFCYYSNEMLAQMGDKVYFVDEDRQLYIFDQQTLDVTEGKILKNSTKFIQTEDGDYIIGFDADLGSVIYQYIDGEFKQVNNPLFKNISANSQFHLVGDKLYVSVSGAEQSMTIYQATLDGEEHSKLFSEVDGLGEFYNDYYFVRDIDTRVSTLYDLKTGETYEEYTPQIIIDDTRFYNGIVIDSNQQDVNLAIHMK